MCQNTVPDSPRDRRRGGPGPGPTPKAPGPRALLLPPLGNPGSFLGLWRVGCLVRGCGWGVDEWVVSLTGAFASCSFHAAQIASSPSACDLRPPRPLAASLRSEQSTGSLRSPGVKGRMRVAGELEPTETVTRKAGGGNRTHDLRFTKASVPMVLDALLAALTVFAERLSGLEGLDDAAAERSSLNKRAG